MRVPIIDTARELAAHANEVWLHRIGDPGLLGGFQVEVFGIDEISGEPLFKSVLYGGRYMVGTAREVKWSQVAYIRAKRPKARKR